MRLSDHMWMALNYIRTSPTYSSVKDPTFNALMRRGLVKYVSDEKYEKVWWYPTRAGEEYPMGRD